MSKLKEQIDKNRASRTETTSSGGKSLLKQQIDAQRSGTTYQPNQSEVGRRVLNGQKTAASDTRKELFVTGSRNIKHQRAEYQKRAAKKQSPSPVLPASAGQNTAQQRSGKSRGAYDSSLRDRLTQQRTREPDTRTNQEQYDWVGQRAVRKKADRKDSGMDGWKLLEGMAVQGATGFAESAASTLDLIERQLLNAQEVFMPTGGERVAQGGPFRALHEGIKKEQEDARAVYQPNVEKGGTAAKVADFLGTTTFEAIPQGAVATISAGANATQAGVNVLNRAAELTPGLWRSIRTAAKGAMENPAFWSSFLQTVGSDYDESIANGASEGQALTMAVANGLLNAGIEVGGGLETMDATKTFGVKDLVKSAVEEGNEEVAQGITQRGLQNLIYQNGNPMFSTTDENAVLNPWTAAQEWGGGAFAGGVLSGASAGTNALMRARYNQQLAELGAVYQGDPEALVEEGLSFAPETRAHQTAAQMQEKASTGRALTDADLGAMVAANEQTMEQQRRLERANAPETQRKAQPNTLAAELEAGKRLDIQSLTDDQMAEWDTENRTDFWVDGADRVYQMQPEQHISQRSTEALGDRSVNAFQFDHPELQPYYKQAAQQLIRDASISIDAPKTGRMERTTQGKRYVQKILDTPSLRLAMNEGLSRSEIISAAQALIHDQGQENYAAAKRLELVLNRMLTEGYTTAEGERIEANADYLQAVQQIPGYQERERVSLPIWDTAETDRAEATRADTQTALSRMAAVRQSATVLGENGTKALTAGYDIATAQDFAPEEIVRGFYPVYNAALNGTELTGKAAEQAAALPKHLRLAAESAGERDAARAAQAQYFGENAGLRRDALERKAHLSSKTRRSLDALGKALGVEVRFAQTVADGAANAQYKNGVITLALDADDPVLTSAVHEAVHRIRETAPEAYQGLAEFVHQSMSEEGERFNLGYRAQLYQTDNADRLTEEMVADAFGRMVGSEELLGQLSTSRPTILQKIADVFHDILAAIQRALNRQNLKLTTEQKAAFQDLEGRVTAMDRAFRKALAAARQAKSLQGRSSDATQQTANKNAVQTDGGTKFSIKRTSQMTLAQQLKMFYDGKMASSDALYFGETPEALNAAGLDPLPLAFTVSDFRKSSKGKHNVPRRVWKNLHSSLETALFSFRQGDRIGIMTGDIDGDGKPLLVGIERNVSMDRTPVNAIRSVYGLDNPGPWLQNQIKAGKELVLLDKEKANAFLQTYGAYSASVGDGIRSMGESVTQNGTEVKTKFSLKEDSQGRKLTEAQQEYFRDSKAVDENGRLLTMYHGSPKGGFTVFRDWQYLTADRKYAERYADKDTGETVYEVYANIKKPFDTRLKECRRLWENEFYGAYSRTPLQESGLPDWTDGYDLVDFLEENDYEYDAILLDEGADPTDEGAAERGISYVIRSSNQIKNVTNQTPTSDPDIRYSLKRTKENRTFVEVDQDILAGVPKADWVATVKENLSKKFPNGITIGNSEINIDKQSRREMTFSRYMQWLYRNDPQVHADKLRATDNADEILYATTGWVNEGLRHPRRDNIRDFARGEVLLRIGSNDYVADVVVGTRKNGAMVLYDVLNLQPSSFAEKETNAAITVNPSPGAGRSAAFVSDSSIRGSGEDVNGEFSRKDKETLAEYVKQYGAIPKGEKAARFVEMPKQTGDGKYLSQTVRTILEAKATPDELVPNIETLAAKGDFSYDRYTDKAAMEDAEQQIKHLGWSQTLTEWTERMKAGEVSKANTAMGWALYNNAANSGDTQTALSVLEQMVAHQRSAAQALQATRILKKLSPETQLYLAQRSVENLQEELNQRFGPKNGPVLEISQDLAEEYLAAETQEQRDEALKNIYRDIGRQMPSTFLDRWNAWRYLAMLGNPRTHVRNIVGNLFFAPVVAAKDLTATGIESAVYRLSGGKMQRSKALVLGTRQGRALLKAAFGDYAKIREAAMGGGKYSDFANANQYIEEGRRIFGSTRSKLWNKTGGALLEAARKGNGTALDAEDAWFSQPHYAYALAQYCKAHNISAAEVQRGKSIKLAREYAILEAQKATYRDTNALSQTFSELGRVNKSSKNAVKKGLATLAEGILPFRKTPANILARGLEYSPLGLMNGIKQATYDVQKGRKTAAEAIDTLSAGLTGTGLLALGVYLAAEGLVRGHGGDDDDKRKMEEMMGHQAYALELPDGTSATLDWMAPEALPFFVGVNLWENTQGGKEQLTLSSVLDSVSTISEPLLEMSCLQSLNDVFDSVSNVSDGGLEGLPAALSSAATSYLTQALPTVLGQAERTGEDKRYTTFTEKNAFLTPDMQYTIGKASAKIPGWDFQQIPYIDAWGRTEPSGNTAARAFQNFLNPAYTSSIQTSGMEKELLRLYESTGEAAVFPDRADKKVTAGGETKQLTADEYVTYAVAKGQESRRMLEDLVRSSEYKAMSDAEKAAAVKNVYDLANQTAKEKVSTYEPQQWVENAVEAERKYRISRETYAALRAMTAGVEGLKDKDGETIQDSKGLQIMEVIYNTPGLNDSQRAAMAEYLGVGKKVRKLNKAAVTEKLERLRKKSGN